jgi:pimeloyl-ACP methyl ester carboxylesterase
MKSTTETLDNEGVRLVYERRGRSDGLAIVFLHGLMESGETFAPIAAALPEHDVYLLDFRGHGESDHAPGHYRIPDFTTDVVCLLEQVVRRPAYLVGHSLGAVAAAYVGQCRTDLLHGLVLEDPPLYLGDRSQWTASVFSLLFPVMQRVVREMQGRDATPAEYSEFIATAGSFTGGKMGKELTAPAIESVGQSLAAMDASLWEVAISGVLWDGFDPDATIDCPSLLLQADPVRGAALLPNHAARLRVTSPRVQIIEVHGSGHFIHNARRFEASYLRHLMAFVAEHENR